MNVHGFAPTEYMLGLPVELRMIITWLRRLNEAKHKRVIGSPGRSGLYYLSNEACFGTSYWHEWVVEIIDGVFISMSWEFHNWVKIGALAHRYESGNRAVQTGTRGHIFTPKHEKFYWVRSQVGDKITWIPDLVVRLTHGEL